MATEQQEVPKTGKKGRRTLRDAIPKAGFEFKKGRGFLESSYDTAAFKAALQQVCPGLSRHDVNQTLASLIKKAKEVKKPGDGDHSVVFERAREQIPWVSELKPGIVPELLLCLINTRELHIKFTRMRPNTVDPSTEGPLAKAIDAYIGDSPATEPEAHYKEMDELDTKYIDDMMDRMRRGVRADWDQYSDCNSDDEGKDEKKEEGKKEKRILPANIFAKMESLKLT